MIMAKRKTIVKKQNMIVQEAIRRPEFWIGVLTVVVLLGVGLYVGMNQLKKMSQTSTIGEKVVSPVPLTQTQVQMSPTPSVTLSRQIKKLADTSGVITTVAQENDNFWNISVRMCGTGVYYETIRSMNGYENKSLQKGDVITVYCW